MRSLFLLLVLANVVVFAAQFDVVRDLVGGTPAVRPPQLRPERMRILREPPTRPRASAPRPSDA